MSDKQDADSFELDELRRQRREVQEEKKFARKEHDKWCANLRNLRGSLVRGRRLLVEKLSASNYRRTFFGHSELGRFVEVQAAIDAIDRALAEEEALQKEHDAWSAENERDWTDAENQVRTTPSPFRRPSFLD
jgi:hypothetical protein